MPRATRMLSPCEVPRPFAPNLYLEVVHILNGPNELLGLHQVEGHAHGAKPVRHDALGRFADYGALHHRMMRAVCVDVLAR